MNYKDFSWWLEGYLTGKEKLDKGEIASILVMLRDVQEEPKVQTFPPPNTPIPRRDITFPPPYVPDLPKPPFNPTCDTGKELLRDSIYGPGNDNYGRDKDPNAVYGEGTFPLEKNAKWRGEY